MGFLPWSSYTFLSAEYFNNIFASANLLFIAASCKALLFDLPGIFGNALCSNSSWHIFVYPKLTTSCYKKKFIIYK